MSGFCVFCVFCERYFCEKLTEVLADDRKGFERKVFFEEVGQVDAEQDGVDSH